MHLTALIFLIAVLATYRGTRFLVYDSLMGANLESGPSWWARKVDAFAYRREDGKDRSFLRGKIGDLLVCPWCTGFWVSLLVTSLLARSVPWHLGIVGWMMVWAVAGAQAMLNVVERRLI